MEPRFHTGDLAVVRSASQYKVGDIVAYHSSLLHLVVLHRIVAISGGHYTFKGDNNNFIDPVKPTRAELLGKLWIHVPRGGVILGAMHSPIVAAIVCALVGAFVMFGAGKQRSRRNRRRQGASGSNRQGIPLVNGPRHHDDGTRLTNHRAFLAASALAVVAFAALAAVAFLRPTDRSTAKVTPYSQQVTFAYSAHVRRNAVYPNGTVSTGAPIFLTMVRQLDLHIDYRLATAADAELTGSEKVVLNVTGPSGWKRAFVLTPRTRFSGSHTSTDVNLDLSQLQALLSKIQTLTGSTGAFSLAVGPQVSISGTVAARPVSTSFHPVLGFLFASGQLEVASAPSGSSSDPSTGSSGGNSLAAFSQMQNGSVSAPARAASTLTVLGVSPQITMLRWIAIIGLLLSIAATVYFYLRKRGEPFEETFRIQAKYGHMIVPIVGGEDLGWPPVDVPSITSLVKLAESGQRLILHNRSDNVDTYMLNEEGTVYRYQVKPSKVIWGEWSDGDAAPVKAAA